MKISVIMIYRYFDFTDISTDILIQNINDVKINENFESIKKNSKKIIKVKKGILKFFFN